MMYTLVFVVLATLCVARESKRAKSHRMFLMLKGWLDTAMRKQTRQCVAFAQENYAARLGKAKS